MVWYMDSSRLPKDIVDTIDAYKPRDRDMNTPVGKIMKRHLEYIEYVKWKHDKNCYNWGCCPERWTEVMINTDLSLVYSSVVPGDDEMCYQCLLPVRAVAET